MSRREYIKTQQGEPTDPNPPAPFVDAQVVNATLVDTITNTVMVSGTAYVNQGGYIYNSSGGYILFSMPIEGIGNRNVYPNAKHRWTTVSPNYPTNGVCPEYFGEGIRLVTTLYCDSLVGDSRANGSAIISCLSHNNANYVGFNVSMKEDISSFYINEYTVFSAPNVTFGLFTIVQNAESPMTIQIDMSETQYRIKLFEYGSTVPIGDSGVRTSSFGTTSKRYSPLMTSNYGQEVSSRPTVYVKSFQYYLESVLSDFML